MYVQLQQNSAGQALLLTQLTGKVEEMGNALDEWQELLAALQGGLATCCRGHAPQHGS